MFSWTCLNTGDIWIGGSRDFPFPDRFSSTQHQEHSLPIGSASKETFIAGSSSEEALALVDCKMGSVLPDDGQSTSCWFARSLDKSQCVSIRSTKCLGPSFVLCGQLQPFVHQRCVKSDLGDHRRRLRKRRQRRQKKRMRTLWQHNFFLSIVQFSWFEIQNLNWFQGIETAETKGPCDLV